MQQQPFYSPNQIALATFLGSPLAGAVLVALNYRRAGDGPAARKAVLLGAAATAVLIPLAMVLPDWFPGPVLPVACVVGAWQLAGWIRQNHLEGRGHPASPGGTPSTLKAAGIGLACLLGVFSLVVAVALVLPERKATFEWVTVHYAGGASESEARELGAHLEQTGVAGEGKKLELHLSRRSKTVLVKMPVPAARRDDRGAVKEYRDLADKLSAEVFNEAPVELHLCNEYMMLKKKVLSTSHAEQ